MVENAFGILANRFRFLHTAMAQDPHNAESCVLAACVLHNILRTCYPGTTNPLVDRENGSGRVVPGTWRNDTALVGIQPMSGNIGRRAKEQREYLRSYYCGPGAVEWQDSMI